MTHKTRWLVGLWVDRFFRVLVIAGCCIAVFAVVRDVQTRNLIDKPAREAVRQVCVQENLRWEAYLTSVQAIAGVRREGETRAGFEQRKAQTQKLIENIRQVVVVDCKE